MKVGYTNLLKNRVFVYLWVSQILSLVTIHMMNFLLLTRLYTVTGSSIATSLLWVAYSLPALFIGPFGAAFVDMVSRKKILMGANIIQSLIIFSYVFVNQTSIFILYAVVLAYSLLNQFYVPAEAAYLPSAVGKKTLPEANSLFFMTIQASLIVGFGFAGIIQRLLGFNGAIALASGFLFLAFISTTFLPDEKPGENLGDKFEETMKRFFASVLEGYQFIRANKSVLYPLLLLLGIQAGLVIVVVNLPVIAENILGIAISLSGLFVVVPAAVGAIFGAVFVPRLMNRRMRKIKIIKNSLTVICVSLALIALALPYLPVYIRVGLAAPLIAITGYSFVGAYLPTLTFLQATTPLWLRGRVFGNLYFLITLVTVFPVLFSGAIAEIFGIRTLILILSSIVCAVLIYSMRRGDRLIKEEF